MKSTSAKTISRTAFRISHGPSAARPRTWPPVALTIAPTNMREHPATCPSSMASRSTTFSEHPPMFATVVAPQARHWRSLPTARKLCSKCPRASRSPGMPVTCMWPSINPGMTVWPDASIRSASAGIETAWLGPTASILSSATTTAPFSIGWRSRPSITRALTMAFLLMVGLGPLREWCAGGQAAPYRHERSTLPGWLPGMSIRDRAASRAPTGSNCASSAW